MHTSHEIANTIGPGQKVLYGCVNQDLANVAALMYYLLRVFPEHLKQLFKILTNIWRFEATYPM